MEEEQASHCCPKLVVMLQSNPFPYGGSGSCGNILLAAPLGSVPSRICWWPHLLFHPCGEGERESLWSLTAQGWLYQKTKNSESHHDSSGFNIVSCKNSHLMSVTISPIPLSNSLSAFFSLTKDESKRPKYKELLVSAKCGCSCQLSKLCWSHSRAVSHV